MQFHKFLKCFGFSVLFLIFSFLTSAVMAESKSYAISYDNEWNTNAIDLSATGQVVTGSQVALNTSGQAIAVWQRSNGSKLVIQTAYSINAGDSWSAVVNLSEDTQNARDPQIAINATGRAIAIWKRYNGSQYVVQTMTSADGGINWTSLTNLSDITKFVNTPHVTINDSNQAIAVWEEASIIKIAYSIDGGLNWLPATFSSGGTSNALPQVVINSSGQAIAVWDDYPGNQIVKTAFSTNGGVSWSSAETLSTGAFANEAQVSLNDANQAMVVWDDDDLVAVKGVYSKDGGENWSSQIDLSPVGIVAVSSGVAINSTGQTVVVWRGGSGSGNFISVISSADGGMNWTSPTTLSVLTTASVVNPQISINDANRASAVWVRNDGSNPIIQSSFSTNGGVTWLPPASVYNLSAAGHDAAIPQIALNSSSVELSVWASNYYVIQASNQLSSFGTIYAEHKKVRFPFELDVVNEITWSSMPGVTAYKVYADAALTEELASYTGLDIFSEHHIQRGVSKTYYFTISISGSESSAVEMNLP